MRLKLISLCLALSLPQIVAAQTESAQHPLTGWLPHTDISYSYFTEDQPHPCNHEFDGTNGTPNAFDASRCATHGVPGYSSFLDRPGCIPSEDMRQS